MNPPPAGNYCKGGRRGRERGNGRVVVAEFWKNATGCGWEVVKKAVIPPSADFQDYSGMDFRGDRVSDAGGGVHVDSGVTG